MANIKITELNGITKKASDDVLAIVDVSADETKKIAVEDLLDKNVELIAVTDTEPAECSYGDKYFNTTDNLIYTAIATDTWSEDGEEPISGILYIVYSEQASYSWNGTELISVGGGKEDIVIDDEEPTDPDVKLWIDTGEVGSQASEITNTYNTSENLGYSCNYVNNRTNIFDLIRFENITAEGSYTLAAGGAVYKGTACPTIKGYKPWLCYEVLGQGNAALKGNTNIPNANNEVGCWVVNTTTSSVTVPGTVFKVMYIKEAS